MGLFDELTGLEQLFLHNNEFVSLPTGVFGNDLEALHYLDLRQNDLVALPRESFENLPALSTLNLSGNKISTLSAGLFPGNLEYLLLADNELGQGAIDHRAFEGLEELQTLTLSNNALETLPARLFSDLQSLTVLGLAGNSNLQCVPSTAGSPALAEEKIVLPVGFAAGGICSCPGDNVCVDCVESELGYICTGCEDEALACQVDRPCQECRIPANEEEQDSWDTCISRYTFRDTCSALSATACCFDELSANDCSQNEAFTGYSNCIIDAVSENVCTSLSCLETQQQTNTFSSEDTSSGGRLKNALVGWAVGFSVTGLVWVGGTVAWV